MKRKTSICRGIALLLCLSLVIGVVPFSLLNIPVEVKAVPEQDEITEQNLLINGDFDGNADGWGGINGAKTTVVDNAMKIFPESSSVCLNQTLEVSAGEKYTLTLKYKAESVSFMPYAGLWFFKNTTSNENCIDVAKVDIADQSGDWVSVKVSGIVPEGANLLQVQIGNSSGFDGTYWLDDMVLTKTVVSVVFSENFTVYAVDGVTGSGPKNWILSDTNNSDHTAVTCFPYGQLSGIPGMTLQAKEATAQSPSFDAVPGTAYTAEFSIIKHGAKKGGYAMLVFTDANGAVAGTEKKILGTASIWTAESISAVAPANAAKAYLVFGITENGDDYSVASLVVTAAIGDAPVPTEPQPTETQPTESTEPFDDGLLLNGGFEQGLKNWGGTSTEGASCTVVTDGAYDGQALLLTANATATDRAVNSYRQSVIVEGIETLQLTAMARGVSAEGAYIGLWFYDINGNLVPENTAYSIPIATSSEWAEYKLIQAVPAGAYSVNVEFGNPSALSGLAYMLDNVSVNAYTDTDRPDPTEPQPTEGTEPAEDGMLLNGGFEQGLENWGGTSTEGASCVVVTDGAFDGHSLLLTANATDTDRAVNSYRQSVIVEGIETLQLTAMARGVSAEGAYIGLWFYDINGNLVPENTAYSIPIATSSEWAEYKLIQAVPAGAYSVNVEFGNPSALSGLAYMLDNIHIQVYTGNEDPNPVEPLPTEPSYGDSILNGGFENGLSGWNGISTEGASNEIVTDGAYDGHSLLLKANSNATDRAVSSFRQTVSVAGLKAVSLSVMAKAVSGNGAYIGLWFYDVSGQLVPKDTAFSIPIATSSTWTLYNLIQAVPEGAVTANIEFGNPSGMTNLAYMLDNVNIEAYTGPEENIQPATPAEPSIGGGSGGDLVDIDDLNGSLEILGADGVPVGWSPLGEAMQFSVLQPADAPDGKNVAQIVKAEYGGCALRSSRVACIPGETYEIKIMVKDIVGTCIISFMIYDENGVRQDAACKSINSLGTGKWQMYSILATMPENAASIELEIWGAQDSTFTCQVDKLRILVSDIKTRPPYVPTEYVYPTVEELTANLSDVYPRIFFTPEEAKEIKLRRFNELKTKYAWSWNEQYKSLLEAADGALQDIEQLQVRGTTGTIIQMNFLEDVNSQYHKDLYLANSYDENGNLQEYPYVGFGPMVTSQYATMMKNCSMAYIMTGKSVYAERAIEIAMAIADWEGWTDEYWVAGHGIFAEASHAWMMEGMVAVFDMCHDRMTEEQLKKLERNIIEEGLIPLSKQVDPNSIVNGNMMMVGGILSGAAVILSKDNAEEIYPYLCAGLLCMHNALDNYAFSGNTEGHYYTDFGLETFMPGVGHLYRATKMDGIIDHYFFTDILPYWTIMWAASGSGTHPNYSDGSVGAYMRLSLAILSKLTDDSLIDGFLINAGGCGNAYNNLIYLKADPQPEYLSDYAAIVEEFGYGALRTGFADDDMLLTLKANDSQMGHNHYDQNSIQLAVGQNWLITDPGAGSYYYADRSFWTHNGHSTILVDGGAQSIKGLSETKMIFNNNLYSYIMGSAEKAYGSDYDSRILEKFDRHAIQVNHVDKGYYVIIDDLLSGKEREYSWQMFNGSRGNFSVDDVDVPEMTRVKGNKVSMPMGKHTLNLNFVDSEKLDIGDMVYSGGYCLTASSAATKAHQFMTVISTDSNILTFDINFTDILNGARSTLPEHIVEGEISWDSSMPLGQEILKPNVIGTTASVFFRGNAIGDWLEMPFNIEEGGTFDFNVLMGVSDGCCTIKVIVDGKYESEPVDCSGLPERFIEVPFGELTLESGTHTVRMEVVDQGHDEDYEPGWYLINAGGISMMRVGVEIPPADDVVVTEVIDNEQALAGMLNYKDNKFDFLMWNRTEGAATAGLLNTDAQQASVLGLIEGVITEGFAATNATTMTYDGKVLFLAEKKVNIVASNTGWQIITDAAQTVQLTAAESEYDYVVLVNGEEVETKIENGILTVAVEAGENTIVVDVDEPEVIEPTEPTETEPSEPAETEPTVAPTETAPVEDGNDATLWIMIGVIVVLLAGAVTGLVIFLKKRKAA